MVDGLDGNGDPCPAVLLHVCVGRRRPGECHARCQPDHGPVGSQAVVEVALVRRPVPGRVEVVGAGELLVGGGESEDLDSVDGGDTWLTNWIMEFTRPSGTTAG